MEWADERQSPGLVGGRTDTWRRHSYIENTKNEQSKHAAIDVGATG